MSAHRACQVLIALFLFPVAGCAVFGSGKNNAVQKDPNFREGYEDGCAAATDQGADLRDRPIGDKQLYANNDIYRTGWRNGFQACRRTDMEPNANPGDNPVRLPGPGH